MAGALDLDDVPDDVLLRGLHERLRDTRGSEADLIALIGEVDRRRLYAREAAPSMYAYCTGRLHLSEAEAYLRLAAARAARRHPVLLDMLRDGRLHVGGVSRLVPHLAADYWDALLPRALHKTRREIDEAIAELAPRPDAPEVIRKLPQRAPPPPSAWAPSAHAAPPAEPAISALPSEGAASLSPDEPRWERTSVPADSRAPIGVPTIEPVRPHPGTAPPSPPPRPAVVEPLSPARFRVQFTASAELHAKLTRLRALARSSVPDGDLATLIEQAVTEKIERLEARRFALTPTPRKDLGHAAPSPPSRYIPAPVRRAVHERDGGRCRYVDASGRRCPERDRLEFHHLHPYAHGGRHEPGNLRLMCPAHNAWLAEHDYGKDAMQRHRGGNGAGGVSEAGAVYGSVPSLSSAT